MKQSLVENHEFLGAHWMSLLMIVLQNFYALILLARLTLGSSKPE
jgi:hypothetical protein